MKDKIRKYIDSLFSNIYETKQLHELKEEISANMLEQINDFVAQGDSEDDAFKKAVSNLGDMSELTESLKKASQTKLNEDMFQSMPIDKKHMIGYIIASAVLLFGLMIGAAEYLQQGNMLTAILYLMPFILVAAPIYIYFGLTQETRQDYGMNSKRALTYSVASEILLFGLFASAIEYAQVESLSLIIFTLTPFIVVSAIIFIYLGLTEKSRRKMGLEWENQWINYYSDPQTAMVRGGISGGLWIFSIAAFFFIGFNFSWKYSWIVFVLAVGCEPLLDAFFASRKRKNK